jgi:TatD DNase family protein
MSEQPFESILDPIFRNSKGKAVEAPALGGMVADTHCHLEMLGNPGLALARCSYHNVMLIVTVVDVCESPAVTYDNLADWEAEASGILDDWGAPTLLPLVKVVAGCHPQNADSYDSNLESVIMRCMSHPLTVAVGEIGLDYFYEGAAHSVQRDVFKRQIELAHKVEKPIVMHVRDSAGKTDAHEDALDILEEEGYPEAGALLHCFTSAPDVMQPFLDNG